MKKIQIEELSLFPGDVLIFNKHRHTYIGMNISFGFYSGDMFIHYVFSRSTGRPASCRYGGGVTVNYLGHEKRPLLEKYCEENNLDLDEVVAEGNPVVTTILSCFRPDIIFDSPAYPRMPDHCI